MTRRQFLIQGAVAFALPWRLDLAEAKPIRFAVIADVHHGLALDAQHRLEAFAEAVRKREGIDLVIQMGDFCHPEPAAASFMECWRRIQNPTLSVLGNHDMDKGSKSDAMRFWGMKSRYGAYEFGGYRFIVLDLNHFKKGGELVAYDHGNYFTDNASHNWADPEQLGWLESELRRGNRPTILVSHQPLGFPATDGTMPPEQAEVLDIVKRASKDNPAGAVVLCLSGHMHVDRLEVHHGIPCYCVNSASYFWSGGMYAYSNPLYAFMEINKEGVLVVEGVTGEFTKSPPEVSNSVIGRSASIGDRHLKL